MDKQFQQRVSRAIYATPRLQVFACGIERGFAGSDEDFNDLDFEKRDEE